MTTEEKRDKDTRYAIFINIIDLFIFLPIFIIFMNIFFSKIFLVSLGNVTSDIVSMNDLSSDIISLSNITFDLWALLVILTIIFKFLLHDIFAFSFKNDGYNDRNKRKGTSLNKLAILLHQNSFVFLWRFLIILFIFLLISYNNPPPKLIVDPNYINETLIIGCKKNNTITVENLGSSLQDITISHFEYRDNNESWIELTQNFTNLNRGSSNFIPIRFNAINLGYGGYASFIYLNATRKTDKRSIIGLTYYVLENNINIKIPVVLNVKRNSS